MELSQKMEKAKKYQPSLALTRSSRMNKQTTELILNLRQYSEGFTDGPGVFKEAADLITKLSKQVDELESVCGEAYQVVGSLLSDVGQFESDHGTKILDNLSEARLVHKDVLPWPSFYSRKPALETYTELVKDTLIDDPLERLRMFCSIALYGMDWVASESFFEDVEKAMGKPVNEG
jgi:hypothetical protein